jgi:hypothetical protein
MTSASTITAISRQDTGQLCKVSARERVGRKILVFLACLLLLLKRSLAPLNPWFPIAHVLAGEHTLFTPPHYRRN